MAPYVEVPLELWCQIFSLCTPPDITPVCKKWASIAHSIPVIWSNVYVSPNHQSLDTLRLHLKRAHGHPLHLFMRPGISNSSIFGTLAKIFETRSAISTIDANLDNVVVLSTFSHIMDISSLLRLTVHEDAFDLSENDYTFAGICISSLLLHSPMLRSLFLPALESCFPVTFPSPDLDHLTTLVVTQSFHTEPISTYAICSILLNTPNLETFYYKAPNNWSWLNNVVTGDILEPRLDQEQAIQLPILLLKLKSVAVTINGVGADILPCINVPALRDFHLDGSRSNLLSLEEQIAFSHFGFLDILQKTATQSPELRRLAITESTLSERTWRWLLCGQPISDGSVQGESSEISLAFPNLETLAVRGFSETCTCGLDDAVLTAFAASPGLTTLKRLVLRRCLAFRGDSLLSALRSIRDKTGKSHLDLELELVGCPGVRESHVVAMQELGVRVKWIDDTESLVVKTREAQLDWWERHAYMARKILDFSQEDWEQEDVRDEKPWWISDVGSLDPSDGWVF